MTRTSEKVSLSLVFGLLTFALIALGGTWNALNGLNEKISNLTSRVAVIESQQQVVARRTGIKFDREATTAKAIDQ